MENEFEFEFALQKKHEFEFEFAFSKMSLSLSFEFKNEFLTTLSKRLLVVHNLQTGQSIIHEFCETDFAFELVEGSP